MSSFDVPTLEFLIDSLRADKNITPKMAAWLKELEADFEKKTGKKP